MIRRLMKEYRMVWPFAAGYLGVAFAFLYGTFTHSPESWQSLIVWPILVFPVAGILLGVSMFGSEFTHGTMPRLLSEPVNRRRIWWEKLGAAAAVFAVVLLATVVATQFAGSDAIRQEGPRHYVSWNGSGAVTTTTLEAQGVSPTKPWDSRPSFLWICFTAEVLAFLFGVTVGPLMSLWLRQTHVAFWAGLVVCMIWYILEQATEGFLLLPLFGISLLNGGNGGFQPFRFVLIQLPLCIAAYLLARRAFLRLEV